MRYLARTLPVNSDSPLRLALFSDTHVGSRYFAKPQFTKFLAESMEHPNAYLMGIGDQIEAILQTDKRFAISGIDSKYLASETPDELLDMQSQDFVNLLKPYQDRLLGLLEGNHEGVMRLKGFGIHRQICTALNCENLGRSCLFLLKLVNGTGRVRSLTIFAHHGFGGGGRTEGGSITKYSRFIHYYDADIYISAHDHDHWTKKVARIGITNTGKMVAKDMILCNTGAFMKTLSDTDTPSWAETRGFPPRSLGGIVLDVTPDSHAWLTVKIVEG